MTVVLEKNFANSSRSIAMMEKDTTKHWIVIYETQNLIF